MNRWGSVGWKLLDWFGRFQSLIDGSPSWYDVSAKTRDQYWECPGNPVVSWEKNGFQTVVKHLVVSAIGTIDFILQMYYV